ncbi:hypothetical protein BN381_100182 [Candidatus Microthrix parvicella RN1]|uniref:Uncharacterized protein n=1 Tax=Candidatus Neomicrothrix parvicella RN1 TaxID=1229780 RepID=R4YWI3_9ACTN|nr:hypothetical protein BN381_100182 [Candidatus Microthrix parvicella RN1]
MLLGRVGDQALQGQHHRPERLVPQPMNLFPGHSEGLGHLVTFGHSSQLRCQALLHLIKSSGHAPNRARGPVGRPDRVQNGAADALRCKSLERDATSVVVTLRCLHQTERTRSCQILTIDMAREMDGYLKNHMIDQVEVGLDQNSSFFFRGHTALLGCRTELAPDVSDTPRRT